MLCPSCRREVPGEVAECPWCGIVFAKWGKSTERPHHPGPTDQSKQEQPASPAPAPAGGSGISRVARVLLLALAGAAVVIGGYWFLEIRPRMKRIEDPYYGVMRSRESRLDLEVAKGAYFDRHAELPIDPLGIASDGHVLLIGNRVDPGGFLQLRPGDKENFVAQTIPVVEPTYSQRVGFHAITWSGWKWVGVTEGAWFQRGDGLVFVTLDPADFRVKEVHAAPPLVGCLAWDGARYWAGTRKNTEEATEEAWLYRLDGDFEIEQRYASPAVGCQGLAWDGSRLWWADVFRGSVLVLDVSGSEPTVVHSESVGLAYPSGIAWDGHSIWMTSYGDKRLHRLRRSVQVAWAGGATEAADDVRAASDGQPEANDEILGLETRLRSRDWVEQMRAEQRLRELGRPIRYARHEDSFVSREEEEMEEIAWEAEVRDSEIRASWRLWFGPQLFEDHTPSMDPSIVSIPIFRRYTVSVEGGTLERKIEKVFDAVPGENAKNDVLLASGVGRGKYEINCFMHTQYVKRDGTNAILNVSAMTLSVEN